MKQLLKNKTGLLPWLLPLILFGMWLGNSIVKVIPVHLLPTPLQIAESLGTYVFAEPASGPYAGRFLGDVTASLMRIAAGFSLAAAVGVPLGLWSGRVRVVEQALSPTIHAVRAVPGITWLPLALAWFGVGMKTTVFLVGLAAFFPIYLNTHTGAAAVDPQMLRAGAMLGVKRVRGLFHIVLPAAVPHIVPGLRLGLGIAWAYLVLGELTGVPNGLGALIMDARMVGRIDMIIVGMIIISVIGKTSDSLMMIILKAAFPSVRRQTGPAEQMQQP